MPEHDPDNLLRRTWLLRATGASGGVVLAAAAFPSWAVWPQAKQPAPPPFLTAQ